MKNSRALAATFAAILLCGSPARADGPEAPAAVPNAAAASVPAGPGPAAAPAPAGETPRTEPVVAEKPVRPSAFPKPGLWERLVSPELSYTGAVDAAKHDQIDSILVRFSSDRALMYIRNREGKLFQTAPLGSARMEKDFEGRGIEINTQNGELVSQVIYAVMVTLQFMLIIFLGVFSVGAMRKYFGNPARRMRRQSKGARVTFDDVAGQDGPKRDLIEIIEFLKDPARFSGLGARVPRGVLLEGDPGNGKTLLARASAGEAGVPFYHIAGSEVLEMFAGLGARRIRKIFAECRRHKSCILFVDEIETIGGKRGQGNGSDVQGERDQILNQLLVELDGMERKGNVVVMGATNRPDMLDPALVRPGRLDRRIHVPKPGARGREGILAVHLRKITLAPDVSVPELARMTPGFSGAELANLCNEAALVAGRLKREAVDLECFHAARDKLLMGEERSPDIMSPEELNVVSFHEAGHALVGLRVEGLDPLHKATILPRGRSLGGVWSLPERDSLLVSVKKVDGTLAMTMGGRAAEAVVFGEGMITSGAVSDIQQATRIARDMAGRMGMVPSLGMVNYLGDEHGQNVASPASLALLDQAVRLKVDTAFSAAREIIERERPALDAIASALRESKTISGARIAEIADAAMTRAAA